MEIQINRKFDNRRNGKTDSTHLYIFHESDKQDEAKIEEIKKQIKLINPEVYSHFIHKIILK